MFVPVVFGLFGLIVGSFLNVLILRWGERPLTGRSECMSCQQKIPWHDLVPVFSWLVLAGRCRSCGASISVQYPLVEGITSVLFICIGLSPLPLYLKFIALLIAGLLVAITVYDLKHTIIPDAWVWLLAGLSLSASLISVVTEPFLSAAVFILLAGPVVAAPLFCFWFFSRGTWMGFGDVKLALGMGWLLGPWGGLQALFLAFMLGGAVSAPLLFFSSSLWERLSRKITPIVASAKARWGFTMKSEIPFGPFLIAATFIIWLLNIYGITFGEFFV